MWSTPRRRRLASQAACIVRVAVDLPRLRVSRVQADAELAGQEHLVAAAGNRATDQHLVGVRAIHIGGVEQGHATVQRVPDDGNAVIVTAAAAVVRAHAHAPQAEGGHGGAGGAESTGLHVDLLGEGATSGWAVARGTASSTPSCG